VKLVQVLLSVNPEKSGGMYMSTVTWVEIGGEGAGSTWKLYVATSLPGPHGSDPMQAVAVTVYPPGRTLATSNEPVIVPPAIEQLLGLPTGLPDNEQTLSLKENPELDVTEIGVPGWSNEELSVIC
jgi:hypothetical protein